MPDEPQETKTMVENGAPAAPIGPFEFEGPGVLLLRGVDDFEGPVRKKFMEDGVPVLKAPPVVVQIRREVLSTIQVFTGREHLQQCVRGDTAWLLTELVKHLSERCEDKR